MQRLTSEIHLVKFKCVQPLWSCDISEVSCDISEVSCDISEMSCDISEVTCDVYNGEEGKWFLSSKCCLIYVDCKQHWEIYNS